MLEALARYSRARLIRRKSNFSTPKEVSPPGPLTEGASSDESLTGKRRLTSNSIVASSAGSLLSNHSEENKGVGQSFTQVVHKFRKRRLRPLSFIGSQIRPGSPSSHSRQASEQRQDATCNFSPSLIPEVAFEFGGEYLLLNSDRLSGTVYMPPTPVSIYSTSHASQGMPATWDSGSQSSVSMNLHSKNNSSDEKELKRASLGSVFPFHYAVGNARRHSARLPRKHELMKSNTLKTFRRGSRQASTLSRTSSASTHPRLIDQAKTASGASDAIHEFLPHSARVATHFPWDFPPLSAMQAADCNLGVEQRLIGLEAEIGADDVSSFVTLSDEGADYESFPHVMPIWPNLSQSIGLPCISEC